MGSGSNPGLPTHRSPNTDPDLKDSTLRGLFRGPGHQVWVTMPQAQAQSEDDEDSDSVEAEAVDKEDLDRSEIKSALLKELSDEGLHVVNHISQVPFDHSEAGTVTVPPTRFDRKVEVHWSNDRAENPRPEEAIEERIENFLEERGIEYVSGDRRVIIPTKE